MYNLRKSEQLLKSGQALIVLVEDNQRLPANLKMKHYLVDYHRIKRTLHLGWVSSTIAVR